MSGSLKEFEKWHDSNATSCDPRTANEEGWKAALEWALKKINEINERGSIIDYMEEELNAKT